MKKCVKCKEEKKLEDYSKRKSSKDGLHPYCKVCVSGIMKIYGEKVDVKNRAKEWKKNHPDRVKIYQKRTYEKNKEDRLQKTHKYNEKNREKINENAKKYYEKNKDEINKKNRNFLASERGREYSNSYYHKTKNIFDVKIKSRNKLRYAVKVGKILKMENCEICLKKAKLHGHHEDYSKPLQVIWVCSYCHKKIHSKQGN